MAQLEWILLLTTFPIILISILIIWLSRSEPGTDIASEIVRKAESELQKLSDENLSGKNYPGTQIVISNFLLRYIYTSLEQNSRIYQMAFGIIIAGFAMTGWGIWIMSQDATGDLLRRGLPALIAGIITEFIAAAIFFVYRSAYKQSIEYFRALERMTTVSISMQILDDLSDDLEAKDTRNQIKADVAKMLLEIQHSAAIHKLGNFEITANNRDQRENK